jgi:hypothetical protein
VANCIPVDARLLAGYVRFATASTTRPTSASTENPQGVVEPLDVVVQQTSPTALAGVVDCLEDLLPDAVAYYCAVPIGTSPSWSGRSELVLATTRVFDPTLPTDPDRRRVCRYTPVRNCQPAVGSTIWGASGATATCSGVAPTPSRLMRNQDHPYDYVGVTTSLVNQNFLVIRAGDGVTAFDCPGDGPSAYANTNTWRHQPPN